MTMTAWLFVTSEPLFDFSCLYLWNISKTCMAHLVWDSVSTDCMRQNLEILSPFRYSTTRLSNQLLFIWPTYSWPWGCPTYKWPHWKWLVGRVPSFNHLKLKSWYLFQAWKLNLRHDNHEVSKLHNNSQHSVQTRPHTDHADTDFPDHIKGYHSCTNIHFLHSYSRGQQTMNCKLVWPKNYWNIWSLIIDYCRGCNF